MRLGKLVFVDTHDDRFYEQRLAAICPDWEERLRERRMLNFVMEQIMNPRPGRSTTFYGAAR